MIFNLGAPSQLDCFDMKPDCTEGDSWTVPAGGDKGRLRDQRDLSEACGSGRQVLAGSQLFITRRLPYTTPGHQMLQTGRLFSGGVVTPHAGCVDVLPARSSVGPYPPM